MIRTEEVVLYKKVKNCLFGKSGVSRFEGEGNVNPCKRNDGCFIDDIIHI